MNNKNESGEENQSPEIKPERLLIIQDMNLDAAIIRCGELQMSFEDTCRLLSDKADPKELLVQLNDPAGRQSELYNKGVSNGRLKIRADLEYNISDPKARDAYKSLKNERREEAINKKIQDLFGL